MIRGYRPDLDGLRSVAVYLVLLFHAGLPWAGGGFIGVDLFFVLSGFLVSSVILGELEKTEHLRLGRFYARRVRRLLPAALVTVVVTCLAFVLFWSVVLRLDVVGDARSALLYYANWHFLAASGDYFATNTDKSPFLHFWSLSIEEQFYLFFPVLLLLLWRARAGVRRRLAIGVTSTLLVLSLVSQLVSATISTDRAYYATDARLYQLLAGALLTLVLLSGRRYAGPRAAHAAAVVGLVGLLVLGSGLLGWTPSWRGIAATVAAVLVLGGLAQAEGSPLSRLLATRVPVYLGQISYGTYLWHWPVIVALRTILDVGPGALALLALFLATGLAALSAEVLELPIRKTPRLDRFAWRVAGAGVAVSALVAAFVVPPVLHQETRPALVSSGTTGVGVAGSAQVQKALDAPVPRGLDLVGAAQQYGTVHFCGRDDPQACTVVEGSGPHVLLVGDSQAQSMVPAFVQIAREHDLTLSVDVVEGCAWQEGLLDNKLSQATQDECARARVGWYGTALKALDPDVVVLLDRPRDSQEAWGGVIVRRDGRDQPLAKMVWQTTRQSLRDITRVAPAIVVQRLVMPETFDPTDCLASARTVGQCAVAVPSSSSPSDGYVAAVAADDTRVHPLDLTDVFCPTAPVCLPLADGRVVWRDDHHYTSGYVSARREQLWDALRSTGLLDGAR